MIKEIVLNGKTIKYDFQRKNVKNINLRIKADRTIFLSANQGVSEQVIEEFIVAKSEYILKALAHYEDLAKYASKPKQYVDGETFIIFGHDRRLKVLPGSKNSVESDESFVILTVKDIGDLDLKKRTMEKWLNDLCKQIINEICCSTYPRFKKYGIDFPIVRFRNMVSRWGSCQPKRCVLTFNYALVEAPISCIEYVVMHEFCHFLQPNHSRKFYQLLAMFMPDWKERKRILERTSSFAE